MNWIQKQNDIAAPRPCLDCDRCLSKAAINEASCVKKLSFGGSLIIRPATNEKTQTSKRLHQRVAAKSHPYWFACSCFTGCHTSIIFLRREAICGCSDDSSFSS